MIDDDKLPTDCGTITWALIVSDEVDLPVTVQVDENGEVVVEADPAPGSQLIRLGDEVPG
jgi:fructose-1,6-bisphosphatase